MCIRDSIYTFFHGDQSIDVVYERDGKTHETTITPRYDKENDRYLFGFYGSGERTKGGPVKTLQYGVYEVKYWIASTLESPVSYTHLVEQVENEETKNSPDADTGKNVEYGKQDQTGQDDANKKKADDGEKLKVYLTFDDGPSTNTQQILDILKQYNVKDVYKRQWQGCSRQRVRI